jgi:hypothetical protein
LIGIASRTNETAKIKRLPEWFKVVTTDKGKTEEFKKKRQSVPNELKRTFAECLGDISRYGSIFSFLLDTLD